MAWVQGIYTCICRCSRKSRDAACGQRCLIADSNRSCEYTSVLHVFHVASHVMCAPMYILRRRSRQNEALRARNQPKPE
jgi:hypothetical protein